MSQRDPDMLPNWDEFGANEELDYNDDPQGQENVSDEPVPGPSSPDAVEEPCSTSAAPSGNDGLPRLNDPTFNNGPPVPNVFWIPDDTAPDDPSCDPEDPDMPSHQIGPVLPTFSNRPRPNNHPSFNPPVPDCNHSGSSRSDRSGGAPSLPDDELRENSHSVSFSLPPPEPTSSRNVPSSVAEDSCPPFSGRVIGPSIPTSSNSSSNNELSMPSVGLGPSLPAQIGPSIPEQVIGPALPNNIGPVIPEPSNGPLCPGREDGPSADENQEDSEPNGELIRGPALPPSRSATIGPAMPPVVLPLDDSRDNQEVEDLYGPAPPPPAEGSRGISLPPEMPSVDDDDEIIGPTLPTSQDDEKAAEEYAIRRLMLEKQKEESTSRREEWMTQLPKKMTNYGLGARTFSKSSTHAEKDSSWTETPEQKRRRIERGEGSSSATDSSNILLTAQQMRDQEQERIALQCNANRTEALLDSHQRKKKNETGQGTSSGERRAFDREKDMEVRGFKGSTSAELKERCGQLSSRFGSSLNQKFL
ncbi:unnamed protein product [Auanema sp. JU1783]|nr:unnamed protein product [Auanema sp. JU1783]